MRLACVGDNVVDCYPHAGVMYPGGNTVNVAVSARRSGCETAYLGAVGDDAAGRLLVDSLTREGVHTERLRIVPGHTAFAVVEIVDGERVFVDSDIGVSELVLTEDDLDYLGGFDLVHTGDCSLLEEQLPLLTSAAMLSFDFSDRPASYFVPLLQHVDVAIFSLGGRPEQEVESTLRHAAEAGPTTVLATLGASGSAMFDSGRFYRANALAADNVVDTLGAGDAFIGRALVGLLSGDEPEDILRDASARALVTLGEVGAFGYPAPLELPAIRSGRRLM